MTSTLIQNLLLEIDIGYDQDSPQELNQTCW